MVNSPQAPPSRPTWLFVLPWSVGIVGGVNQVVLSLAREMRASGAFAPLIGVNVWGRYRSVTSSHDDLPVIELWAPGPWTEHRPVTGAMRALLELPFTLWRLSRLLRRHGVGVVNVHYPNLTALNWLLLRVTGLFRGTVILSLHGRDVRDAACGSALQRLLWRIMLRQADRVVACSDGLADEITAAFGSLPLDIVTIHNGVAFGGSTASRSHPMYGGTLPVRRRDYVLNLATFESKKGQDLLVEAFHTIASRYPKLDLVLAGRRGHALDPLRQQIRELGLDTRVRLLRDLAHDEALALLEDARFFVLPSRNEGFAIALLEACSFAKPVIATDVCGVAELIEDGATGRIVPAESAAAIADAMVEFLDHPERANAMGAAAQALVQRRFDWRTKCADYVHLATS